MKFQGDQMRQIANPGYKDTDAFRLGRDHVLEQRIIRILWLSKTFKISRFQQTMDYEKTHQEKLIYPLRNMTWKFNLSVHHPLRRNRYYAVRRNFSTESSIHFPNWRSSRPLKIWLQTRCLSARIECIDS